MNEDVYICKSYFLTCGTASDWQGVEFQVAFCHFCGWYPWDCWHVVLYAAHAEQSDSCCMQEYYLWLPWSCEIIAWELSEERLIMSWRLLVSCVFLAGRSLKRSSFLRGSQRVEVWRLGERAPGEAKLQGFSGRSFSFDNRPDRVKKRWLEEEKQCLLSKGEAVCGAGRFGISALCSSCGVSRKRILGCETHQGRMSWRGAGDAHGPGGAQTGPYQSPWGVSKPRLGEYERNYARLISKFSVLFKDRP